MSELSLRVTERVIAHAQGERVGERQIAYSSPSADITEKLAAITKINPVTLRIGGFMAFVVADSSAIWRVHNEKASDDFDALFALLARYPSRRMRFVCEVVE